MSGKLPSGSAAASGSGRVRAQISYEGTDEFSAFSLDPRRRSQLKQTRELNPEGAHAVRVDKLKRMNDQSPTSFFRKIFAL